MAFDIKSAGGNGFSTNGNGYSFPSVVLNDATGNEVAFTLNYTTNKATSGNDTGLVINQTDTLSPGTSLLQDWQVGGTSVVNVNNVGQFDWGSNITMRPDSGGGAGIFIGHGSGATVKIFSSPRLEVSMINVGEFGWSSSTAGGTLDTYLTRISAGAMRVHGLLGVNSTVGLTADTGSSQGDGPLTVGMNEISVCANAGDARTMPEAVAGVSYTVTIINNGAQAMDVFPFSGDNLGAGVNIAVSLAAGADITYTSYDATNWFVKT